MLVRFSLLDINWIHFVCQKSTASSHRSRCQSARRVTCHLVTTWSTSRCSPPRTNQRCSAVRTSSPTASLLLCPPHTTHPSCSSSHPWLRPPNLRKQTASVWRGRVTPHSYPPHHPPQVNTSQSPNGVTPPSCCSAGISHHIRFHELRWRHTNVLNYECDSFLHVSVWSVFLWSFVLYHKYW